MLTVDFLTLRTSLDASTLACVNANLMWLHLREIDRFLTLNKMTAEFMWTVCTKRILVERFRILPLFLIILITANSTLFPVTMKICEFLLFFSYICFVSTFLLFLSSLLSVMYFLCRNLCYSLLSSLLFYSPCFFIPLRTELNWVLGSQSSKSYGLTHLHFPANLLKCSSRALVSSSSETHSLMFIYDRVSQHWLISGKSRTVNVAA
jgi:hypothetical protein